MAAGGEGNVGALKEFGKLLDRNDQMEAERSLGSDDKPKPEAPRGKKIVDAERAVNADADLMAELEQEALQNARTIQ